jgi:hypothetical protein
VQRTPAGFNSGAAVLSRAAFKRSTKAELAWSAIGLDIRPPLVCDQDPPAVPVPVVKVARLSLPLYNGRSVLQCWQAVLVAVRFMHTFVTCLPFVTNPVLQARRPGYLLELGGWCSAQACRS